MLDMALIRPALLENLADLCEAEGLQQSPYMLANAQPPTVQITGLGEIIYDVANQRGGDENEVIVTAFVSTVSDEGGQIKLDRMLMSSGPSSVKEAIEKKDTDDDGRVSLGGLIDDLRVTRCSGHQLWQRPDGSAAVVGAQWFVQIETTE